MIPTVTPWSFRPRPSDHRGVSFLQSRTRSAREGFGKPILRKEDARLLVGMGCYSDDVNLPGQAHACFVRSPHAHARIRGIDTAAARAAHVVRLDTWVQRVTGVTMEPRAAVGVWHPACDRYTIHAGAGGLGRTRTGVAGALGVPESAVRVVAREVGGNFGTRNSCYPEFALVAWAARRLGRPVKWTGERREAFLADYQGRDLTVHAELALDASGGFLAFRGANTS